MKTSQNILVGVMVLLLVGGVILWNRSASQPSITTSRDTPSISPSSSTSTPNLYPAGSLTHIHGFSTDVEDPKRLYIATHHGLLVLLDGKDLYRLGKSEDDFMGFSVHPKKADIFYSSGHPITGGNIGVQVSKDGGVTWEKLSDGIDGPVDFHAMTVSAVNPDLLYGWHGGKIQRSQDGGKNWQVVANMPVALRSLLGDPQDANFVYALTPQGLLASQDQGVTWKEIGTLKKDGRYSAFIVRPTDSKYLLVFSDKVGLLVTQDKGVTWKEVKTPFGKETVIYFSYSYQNPNEVYALTNNSAVYRSMDNGETWRKIR